MAAACVTTHMTNSRYFALHAASSWTSLLLLLLLLSYSEAGNSHVLHESFCLLWLVCGWLLLLV
jgi:hypothetical protein